MISISPTTSRIFKFNIDFFNFSVGETVGRHPTTSGGLRQFFGNLNSIFYNFRRTPYTPSILVNLRNLNKYLGMHSLFETRISQSPISSILTIFRNLVELWSKFELLLGLHPTYDTSYDIIT